MSNSAIGLIIITTSLIVLLGSFIILAIFLYQKNQLRAQKSIEEIKSNQEKKILESQVEIQEQTFDHISREIHDNISLDLTLSKLHLNTLNYPTPAVNQEKINSSIQLIGNVIQKLNNISKSLDPGLVKEHGLFHALENEISIIRKTGIYKVAYAVNGIPRSIQPDKALIIFRIIQESLNNIIKHAKASTISLALNFNEHLLDINIEDNGVGFESRNSKINIFNGLGIKNIRKRTTMLDGEFEIISYIGKGTQLKFRIPLQIHKYHQL